MNSYNNKNHNNNINNNYNKKNHNNNINNNYSVSRKKWAAVFA